MISKKAKEKISKLKPVFDKIEPSLLEAMPYEYPGKRIEIIIETDEFTCLCPWSGLPDFANVKITYVPNRSVVELKSLKYYLQTFRMVGMVHESVVNIILKNVSSAVKPKSMIVEIKFKTRGGIDTTVIAKLN
jgi:7-cyano-7-deazaguanine reductase